MVPLFIPIVLGTARKGRRSENAARFVFEETKKRAGVETEFVDICKIPMRLDDAGEQMKDPAFSDLVKRADGLILVVPEYNHGYPGLLKHALDMNLEEYIHKAVGICGVSAGVLDMPAEFSLKTASCSMNVSSGGRQDFSMS